MGLRRCGLIIILLLAISISFFIVYASPPTVTLVSPPANYVNDSSDPINVTFECNATNDINLVNMSLYLTNNTNQSFGLNQTANVSGTNSSSTTWNLTLGNGNYTWNCLAFDIWDNSSWGASNRSIIINYSAPVDNSPNTTLVSPANGNVTSSNNVSFTCNATDDIQLTNITFYWDYSGSWQANGTVSVSGTSNQTTFTRTNLSNGAILWNCLAYDNASQSDWGDSNYTVTVNYTAPDTTAPTVNLESPSNGTTDTDGDVVFEYNVTDESSVSNCSLIINAAVDQTDSSITKNITQNFTKTSISNGNYNWSVNCTDSSGNQGNSSTRSLTISVSAAPPPTGDGRGAAGAPTPTEEEEFVEVLRDLEEGTNLFTDLGDTIIEEIELELNEDVKDVGLIIEPLPELPKDVEKLNDTYKNFNMTLENITNESIETITIRFSVSKAWIDENNYDASTVALNRWTGSEWQELPTKYLRETDIAIIYEAETESFSIFTIIAEKLLPRGVIELPLYTEFKVTPITPSREEWMTVYLIMLVVSALIGALVLYGRKRRAEKEITEAAAVQKTWTQKFLPVNKKGSIRLLFVLAAFIVLLALSSAALADVLSEPYEADNAYRGVECGEKIWCHGGGWFKWECFKDRLHTTYCKPKDTCISVPDVSYCITLDWTFGVDCSVGAQGIGTCRDDAAPIITHTATAEITSAEISWSTDELCTEAALNVKEPGKAYVHTSVDTEDKDSWSKTITGLSPDTLYEYEASACDMARNCASETGTFRTKEMPELEITNVQVIPSAHSVTITWDTNLDADSKVDVYDVPAKSSAEYVKSHSITITGLNPDEDYFCDIFSESRDGLTATANCNFKTLKEGLPDLIIEYATVTLDIYEIASVKEFGFEDLEETGCGKTGKGRQFYIPIRIKNIGEAPIDENDQPTYGVIISVCENIKPCVMQWSLEDLTPTIILASGAVMKTPPYEKYDYSDHFTFCYEPGDLTPGKKTYVITIDSKNEVEESDETNNDYELEFNILSWPGPVQPNLIVEDIIFSPSAPKVGEEVTVTAKISNIGSADAWFPASACVGGVCTFTKVAQLTWQNEVVGDWLPYSDYTIKTDETKEITFSQTVTSDKEGTKTAKVKVDPDNVIEESDETDNELSKKLTFGELEPDFVPSEIKSCFALTAKGIEMNCPNSERGPQDIFVIEEGETDIVFVYSPMNLGDSVHYPGSNWDKVTINGNKLYSPFSDPNQKPNKLWESPHTWGGGIMLYTNPPHTNPDLDYHMIYDGDYEIVIVLDPEDLMEESDETNNIATHTIHIVTKGVGCGSEFSLDVGTRAIFDSTFVKLHSIGSDYAIVHATRDDITKGAHISPVGGVGYFFDRAFAIELKDLGDNSATLALRCEASRADTGVDDASTSVREEDMLSGETVDIDTTVKESLPPKITGGSIFAAALAGFRPPAGPPVEVKLGETIPEYKVAFYYEKAKPKVVPETEGGFGDSLRNFLGFAVLAGGEGGLGDAGVEVEGDFIVTLPTFIGEQVIPEHTITKTTYQTVTQPWTLPEPGVYDLIIKVDPDDIIFEKNRNNNELRMTVTVLENPEAVCEYDGGNITFSPSTATVGSAVKFAAFDFSEICNNKILDLRLNNCSSGTTASCVVLKGRCAGNFTAENEGTNNYVLCDTSIDTEYKGSLFVNVTEVMEIADLSIDESDISISQDGDTVIIGIEIENTGTADVDFFTAQVEVHGTNNIWLVPTFVNANDTNEIMIEWTGAPPGEYTLRVELDPNNQVEEMSKYNNLARKEFTVR